MDELEFLERYSIDESDSGAFLKLSLIPDNFTLQRYIRLFTQSPIYLRLFWNSVILVVPILLGQCLISPLSAYAFEFMLWKYKEILYYIFIVVMLLPLQILLVPHFIVADWLGINGTYWAIILPGIFNPFGVFILRQQLRGFPKECIDAGKMDGANEWVGFRSIVLPNMKPAIAALCILTFVEYWNIVDQAIIFTKSYFQQPLSVYLSRIVETDPGMFFAVSSFYMVPAILIFAYGHEHLAQGITLSGVRN